MFGATRLHQPIHVDPLDLWVFVVQLGAFLPTAYPHVGMNGVAACANCGEFFGGAICEG